jgi:hypothetical protein
MRKGESRRENSMSSEKPSTAFILSLIGGIFVLLGGLIWAAIGTFIAFLSFGAGFLLYVFLIFGIIIIIGAFMFNSKPASARTWGIVILLLGIFSLFGVITALGGILSIVGGALALSWSPRQQPPPAPPTQ